MKLKDTNHKTPLIGLSKNVLWDYNPSSQAFMLFPEKDAWRERLIYSLFEWFKNPRHLVIEGFLFEYGIQRRTFDRWQLKFQDIHDAVEDIKIFLGARRREGTMRGELQYGAAYRDMHCYDPQWGPQVDQYHAQLKSTEGKAEGSNEVYIVERCAHRKADEPRSIEGTE